MQEIMILFCFHSFFYILYKPTLTIPLQFILHINNEVNISDTIISLMINIGRSICSKHSLMQALAATNDYTKLFLIFLGVI